MPDYTVKILSTIQADTLEQAAEIMVAELRKAEPVYVLVADDDIDSPGTVVLVS